jgi:heat shock protein HslJ
MRHALRASATVLAAMLLLAPMATRADGQMDMTKVIGPEWAVQAIDGKPVLPASQVTMSFGADGSLAGRATCNRYSARYTADGETFALGPAISTKMACAPELMMQEDAFLRFLSGARRIFLDGEDRLVLVDERGRELVARRP